MVKKLPPIVAIFFTVFLDLLSFGVVIPDIQIRAASLVDPASTGAYTGAMIGISIALFSIAQLAFAPMLGRLSDRVGRKNILLLTAALATLGAVAYAYSTTIGVLWLARILQGVAAANLGVAYAAISDFTKPSDRSKAMGKIGAAFGLGFILGPPLGGWLAEVGQGSPIYIGYVSAALALLNVVFIALFLPSSPVKERDESLPKTTIGLLRLAFIDPNFRVVLLLFFTASFAFSNLESTFFRLSEDVYRIDRVSASLVLVVVGVVAAVMQGLLIGPLVKRFGDRTLLRVGFLIQIPILATVPFVKPWIPLLIGVVCLGIGTALSGPTTSSLISRLSPAAIIGATFGVTQALGALARIFGPLVGSFLYQIAPYWPYICASAVMVIPLLLSLRIQVPSIESEEQVPATS